MKYIIMFMAMVSIAFAQTPGTTRADLEDQLKVGEVSTENYSYYDCSYENLEEDVEVFSGEVLTVKRLLSAWLKNNKGKVVITDRLQSGDAKALVITVFYHRLPEPQVKEPVKPEEKK